MPLLRITTLLHVLVFLSLRAYAGNDKISARFQLVDCGDDKDLDGMYTDAISLAQNAIKVLDSLAKANLILPGEQTLEAYDAQFMFAAKRAPLGLGFTDEGTDRLNTAKNNYQRVLDALQTGLDMQLSEHFIICGDDNLEKTTKLSDLGPIGASQADFDAMYGATGVWYAKNSKDFQGVMKVIFTQGVALNGPHPICTSDPVLGVTVARVIHPTEPRDLDNSGIKKDGLDLGVRKIVICDPMWDENRLRKSIGEQGKDLGGDDPNPDDIQSRGGAFLHEMFHVMDRSVAGETWSDKKVDANTVAYKFTGAAKLAMTDDWDDISTNPDNYRVFAEMVWMSKTKWRGIKPKGASSSAAADFIEEDLFEDASEGESIL